MIQVQDIIAELSRHSPTTIVEGYNGIEGIAGKRTITMLTEEPQDIQKSYETGVEEGKEEGFEEGAAQGFKDGFEKCRGVVSEFAHRMAEDIDGLKHED